MPIGMGEERTAGSDPKIRFSSEGPISLDHAKKTFFTFNLPSYKIG
jgi:hypothetical protein